MVAIGEGRIEKGWGWVGSGEGGEGEGEGGGGVQYSLSSIAQSTSVPSWVKGVIMVG